MYLNKHKIVINLWTNTNNCSFIEKYIYKLINKFKKFNNAEKGKHKKSERETQFYVPTGRVQIVVFKGILNIRDIFNAYPITQIIGPNNNLANFFGRFKLPDCADKVIAVLCLQRSAGQVQIFIIERKCDIPNTNRDPH